mgnify:CR=1 FL=1
MLHRTPLAAARKVMPDHDLTLVYVPHLDYDLQRFGPDSPQAVQAARAVQCIVQLGVDEVLDRFAKVLSGDGHGVNPCALAARFAAP